MPDAVKMLKQSLANVKRAEARAQKEVDRLKARREELTKKIELADTVRMHRTREVILAERALKLARDFERDTRKENT